jgi:hypothetical protein
LRAAEVLRDDDPHERAEAPADRRAPMNAEA